MDVDQAEAILRVEVGSKVSSNDFKRAAQEILMIIC
jgi:hypothetical protein